MERRRKRRMRRRMMKMKMIALMRVLSGETFSVHHFLLSFPPSSESSDNSFESEES